MATQAVQWRCATRAIKNAKYLQKVAPDIMPAVEPPEGFASVIPLHILEQAHFPDVEIPAGADPRLNALKKVTFPVLAFTTAEPLFNGTLYFVRFLFTIQNQGNAVISVSSADMATAVNYATQAAPAISPYAALYGPNAISVNQTVLTFSVTLSNNRYNDSQLQGWVNTIVSNNGLPGSACIVILDPQGVVNTDGDPANGIGGYHSKANVPYCFVNVFGQNLTVADLAGVYVQQLSHEIAEMTVDPNVDGKNPEVCDACGPNCQGVFLDYFDNGGNYINTSQAFPPGFNYNFFINGIVQPSFASQCPAPACACAYWPTTNTLPVVTWQQPADIVYGTPLSSAQLNADGCEPGTYLYSPPAGTCLPAGVQTLTVTFTPNDATQNPVTKTVPLNVVKATPIINWSNPADIVYGTALSAAQLNASASWVVCGTTVNVPGVFTYAPALGDCLTAGLQTLSVTFAPFDMADYNPAFATVLLNVQKATPVITWPNPTDIDHGTPLDSTQLDATASWVVCGNPVSIPGTFTYNPLAGTILNIGNNQMLSVSFAPVDAADYNPATGTAFINVLTGYPIVTGVTFAPTVLQWNDSTNVTVTVKNDSIHPHPTQGPDPGFEYSEGDTFNSKGFPSIAGAYRIAVDMENSPYKQPYLYRWGFGHDLAPGEVVTVGGAIRFHNSRENGQYFVAMIEEVDEVLEDHQGTTGITVERP